MGLFELIWAVIIGVIVGFVARFVLPGRDPMGLIMTAVLGIAGSLVGTFIGRNVLHLRPGYSAGFIMSVIGAVVLLLLYRMIASRST